MMTREGWHRCLSWWFLVWLLRQELAQAKPMTTPIVHPEIMTLENLPTSVQPTGAISMWRNAPFLLNFQSALPAQPGAMFDGPDPGMRRSQGNPIITQHQLLVYVLDDQGPSPNIINIPESSCPSGYRRDTGGVCRIILGLGYGPNPFHSFQPENFKGDLQFYMGLKVGRPSRPSRPFRRRPRLRGRPRRPGQIGGSAKLSPAVRGRARAPVQDQIQPVEVQQNQNKDKNNDNNDDDDD